MLPASPAPASTTRPSEPLSPARDEQEHVQREGRPAGQDHRPPPHPVGDVAGDVAARGGEAGADEQRDRERRRVGVELVDRPDAHEAPERRGGQGARKADADHRPHRRLDVVAPDHPREAGHAGRNAGQMSPNARPMASHTPSRVTRTHNRKADSETGSQLRSARLERNQTRFSRPVLGSRSSRSPRTARAGSSVRRPRSSKRRAPRVSSSFSLIAALSSLRISLTGPASGSRW